MGENDLTKRDDCFTDYGTPECAPSPLDIDIDAIILHPNFTTNTSSYDIGLIRLADDVIYSDFVKPICIPLDRRHTNESTSGDILFIAGWRNGTSTEMVMKKKSRVKIYDRDRCFEKYCTYLDYEITDGHTCLSDGVREVGTCQISGAGDPLMRFDRGTRSWRIEGILTYDYSCVGGKDWPAVYTNVGDYLQWILMEIN